MALWDKRFGNTDDDLPPELRDKTPAQIAAALKKAAETEAALTAANTAKTAAETAAQAQQTEFQAMKDKLAALEANAQKTPEQLEAERLAAEPASPWVDPEKFVQDQTKNTTMLALQSGMLTAKLYFMQSLTPRDKKIFTKYEKEVEQNVNSMMPQQRVMPQTWFNMLLYVKGVHEQEIAKAEQSSTDFFSETPSRGQTPDAEQQSNEKLTAAEEETCRIFHYDPVKYLENKKKGQVLQAEKGAYSRYAVPVKQSV
jgi:hypothetical protein